MEGFKPKKTFRKQGPINEAALNAKRGSNAAFEEMGKLLCEYGMNMDKSREICEENHIYELEDIGQIFAIGALRAYERWDTKGSAFMSYAFSRAIGYIADSIQDKFGKVVSWVYYKHVFKAPKMSYLDKVVVHKDSNSLTLKDVIDYNKADTRSLTTEQQTIKDDQIAHMIDLCFCLAKIEARRPSGMKTEHLLDKLYWGNVDSQKEYAKIYKRSEASVSTRLYQYRNRARNMLETAGWSIHDAY